MVRFEPLRPSHFPVLLDWLQRPHVKTWWDDGDDTLEKVIAHYTRDPANVKRFIAERNGEPVGYFQYHLLEHGHVGTDQFLANGDQLSKGLGTRCLTAFVDLILAQEAPARISVDPDPRNTRAIRCYEKCGFVLVPARSSATVHFMTRAV